jgi:hypothetical protein
MYEAMSGDLCSTVFKPMNKNMEEDLKREGKRFFNQVLEPFSFLFLPKKKSDERVAI